MKSSCTVILLNWNGRALLEEYLPSVVEHTPTHQARILIADNGSTDDSRLFVEQHYPEVGWLDLGQNWGFAEGYNRAIAECTSEIIVLLNTDVRVTEGWLDEPLELLRVHPEIAAVQPKICALKEPSRFEYAGAAGGMLDKFGYPFCRGRVFASLESDKGQYDKPASIFWASGAALFIKRACYLEVGGLDADFFAHQEEIDLCWRLHLRKYQVSYAPSSLVYHLGGGTLNAASPRKTFLNYRNNLLMLYKNMPIKELKRVLRIRFCMDLLAALLDLSRVRFSHAFAVFRAWRDFRRLQRTFLSKRNAIQASKLAEPYPRLFAPYSVVWQYFARGKRRFTDLPKKEEM